jgi:hypothetical protein
VLVQSELMRSLRADSSVDNIEEACERFEKMGVQFKKKLTDGKMKHIAFILDCDGYASFIGVGERELTDIIFIDTGSKLSRRSSACKEAGKVHERAQKVIV